MFQKKEKRKLGAMERNVDANRVMMDEDAKNENCLATRVTN